MCGKWNSEREDCLLNGCESSIIESSCMKQGDEFHAVPHLAINEWGRIPYESLSDPTYNSKIILLARYAACTNQQRNRRLHAIVALQNRSTQDVVPNPTEPSKKGL